jgi:hypothetical protein
VDARADLPLNVIVRDESGVSRVGLTVNGAAVDLIFLRERAPGGGARVVVADATIALRPGANVVVVTAENAVGRTKSVSRTVQRTPGVAAVPPSTGRGNRYAVVIGAGIFDNPRIPRLRFAENDARAVYQFLTTKAGYRRDDVMLVTDSAEQKPTLANLKRVLGDWLYRTARRGDSVFVYFAGYGSREVDPAGAAASYLIPRDADPESLFVTAFAMDDVETIFRRIAADRVVFVMDASFGGPPQAYPPGRTLVGQGAAAAPFDDIGKISDRILITASGSTEAAIEVPELRHGLFTWHLLRGMEGAADADRDGIVTADELYQYVQREMLTDSGKHSAGQMPTLIGSGAGIPLFAVK